jgi:glycosyltransferase involved in cell wall biosynthesis
LLGLVQIQTFLSADLKISIITVCLNSAATLNDALHSVANQTHQDVEHIVIDGGSTDNTADIIAANPQISRYVSEPDQGMYDAMNKGVALASGEIIGILNADDFYADESVLTQVAEIFANPAIDACYADLVYVGRQDVTRVARYWKSCAYRPGLFERGWMPAHPTFFVRRAVYANYGNFDLSFRRQADFELTMRFLAKHQIISVYIPKTWVIMRLGGVSNNSVSGIIKGNIEGFRAYKKNGLTAYILPFIAHKILSRVPQFFKRPNPPAV